MKKIIVILSLFLVSGCALKLRSEFNPVGKYDSVLANKPIVSSHSEISIYLKSAPDGFTLKENELQVEEGYNHKVLGEVNIVHKSGFSDVGISHLKSQVVDKFKQSAYETGANAVIYCVVNVSEKSNRFETKRACTIGFGSGWAVIAEEKHLK